MTTPRPRGFPPRASRDWLSSAEAATVCRMSGSVTRRLMDAGKIKSWLVPGTRHRRVLKADLRRFMAANDIPTDLLDTATEGTR